VAGQLGRAPQRCAAVEDSANGLSSAAAARLQVIAVPRPQFPPGSAALAKASLILAGLDDLTVQAISTMPDHRKNRPRQ
jgi:beta-phosphoglucomutase-like phosphatase (HAD superfamily)